MELVYFKPFLFRLGRVRPRLSYVRKEPLNSRVGMAPLDLLLVVKLFVFCR